MAFIPGACIFPARPTVGRSRLMGSPPRAPAAVPALGRRRASPAPPGVPPASAAAAPPPLSMTLAAVGRPPAAAPPPPPPLSMTLAAVGRPPAAAAPPPPPSGAGGAAASSSAAAVSVEQPVVPITSFEAYMEMLEVSATSVVVLKFYAPWCRSCRAIAPKVARLAHEFPEIRFYEIDYEANKELCWRLGVKNLPTFHFYSGAAGRVEDFNAGPARAHVIREKVVEYALGSCPLPAAAEAAAAADGAAVAAAPAPVGAAPARQGAAPAPVGGGTSPALAGGGSSSGWGSA